MPSIDALVLRRAGLITLAVGVIATVIGTALRGTPGLVGGVLGTVIVIAFFSVGQLFLGRVLENNPQMALTAALTIYLVKIGVLLLLLFLLSDVTWMDPKVFASTILACTIVWTVVEVWLFGKSKVLYVEPASGKEPRS